MKQSIDYKPGQYVMVSHDQGLELGEIYSINYISGKAVIYISNPDCPHYFGANISQLHEYKTVLV